MPNERQVRWADQAATKLVGRKIIGVRYLNEEEMDSLGWDRSTLMIVLSGEGNPVLFASQDDEGNGPGALFTDFEDLPTIPVI